MIKQIWVAECDICGAVEAAKITHPWMNEEERSLPDEWQHGFTEQTCICPECWYKINGKANVKPKTDKPKTLCQFYIYSRNDPNNGWCQGTKEQDPCPYEGDWRLCDGGRGQVKK